MAVHEHEKMLIFMHKTLLEITSVFIHALHIYRKYDTQLRTVWGCRPLQESE